MDYFIAAIGLAQVVLLAAAVRELRTNAANRRAALAQYGLKPPSDGAPTI